VDKRKRGEGDNMLGDRLQDNISARAETRGFSEQQQAVRTPGACQTPPCLQWARILQVYFRPCRTRVRAFLGRLRAKYVTKGFLMLKPGLARLPARVHASKQRFLAGRVQ
jgi:hypothetical protein